MIDKSAPIPLYYQVKEDIKLKINNNEFTMGQKLPTESWLTDFYSVSRVTIRKAMSELISEGYLESVRGKGTFVASEKVDLPLAKMTSLHKMLTDVGIKSSSKILSIKYEDANAELARDIGVAKGEPLTIVRRIRYANDSPINLQTSYLRTKLCEKFDPNELEYRSLLDILESECNVKINHQSQVIDIKTPTKEIMKHLELEDNSPLLYMQSKVYNNDGKVIEYSTNYYVPDRYKYTVTVFYGSK